MRKALFLILFLAAWAAMSSAVSAGLTTGLLGSQNVNNDTIQDKSLGFLLDFGADGASPGDIAFGLIRVDSINNLSVKPSVSSPKSFVYMVFSAEILAPVGPMDPYDFGVTILPHTWIDGASPWSLKSLLGSVTNAGAISNGSLAALVETTTAVDFGAGVDFDLGTISATPTALKTAIGGAAGVFASNGGSVLATFGFTPGDPDFYHLDPAASPAARFQHAGLSVIDSFVGPLTDWKLLKPDPYASPATHEIAIDVGGSLTDTGGPFFDPVAGVTYRTTKDQATYLANYVPEPGTISAMLGMALMSGLGLLRRRARKS